MFGEKSMCRITVYEGKGVVVTCYFTNTSFKELVGVEVTHA